MNAGLIMDQMQQDAPPMLAQASSNGLISSRMLEESASPDQQVLGFPLRSKLFGGEDEFFKANPHVAGMAAEDGAVVLNPYSKLKPEELQAVAMNEAIRLHMRKADINPQIEVTSEQDRFFQGTPYANADKEKRQTIIARILTGDPSVSPTPEQQKEAQRIMQLIGQSMNGGTP